MKTSNRLSGVALLLVATTVTALIGCENTLVSEYDTVKAKKFILIDESGKEHALTVNESGELVVSE